MSRIGRKPIAVPAGVKIQIAPTSVEVQGPKGKMSVNLPKEFISSRRARNSMPSARATSHAALHGLARALVANAVRGVRRASRRIWTSSASDIAPS